MRGIIIEKIGKLAIFKADNMYRVIRTSKKSDFRVFESESIDECKNFIYSHPYGLTIAEAEAIAF